MSAPAGLDLLTVTGLEVWGHHGVLARERRDGQPFVIDLVLALDLAPAGRDDDLSLTVDYGTLSAGVHDAVASDPVELIETLAERVARLCLASGPVAWVQVTVHKPRAPIPVTFADVTVTIERSAT